MPKRTILFFWVWMGLLSALTLQAQSTRPNIIFIMSDDHTSQAWGIYGGLLKDYVQNQNIKRLAEEGAQLNNVFCTNSICVPSRASIMSGQYSHHNGVYTLADSLDGRRENIAKTLQAAGYHTALFGKWHLKSRPTGFDAFTVLPGQGLYHNPTFRTADYWDKAGQPTIQKQGFSTDIITDLALEWLEDQSKDQPFFLMCHFKATHEPFDYAPRFADLYNDIEIPMPDNITDIGPASSNRVFPGHPLNILGERYQLASSGEFWTKYPGEEFTVEGLDTLEARYKTYQKFIKDFMRSGAGIDENIGRILDFLDEHQLTENTVIIYTSDQGYFLGEHGFFDKRMMLEESLRMPFVIRYPKEIEAQSKIDECILNIDFPALFADYAQVPQPDYIQGQSFRPLLKGEKQKKWREEMYYRYWTHSPTRPAHFGIRNERYKLIYYYAQPMETIGTSSEYQALGWELYDLKKDPGENHNVYHQSKYHSTVKKLKRQLKRAQSEVGDSFSETWLP